MKIIFYAPASRHPQLTPDALHAFRTWAHRRISTQWPSAEVVVSEADRDVVYDVSIDPNEEFEMVAMYRLALGMVAFFDSLVGWWVRSLRRYELKNSAGAVDWEASYRSLNARCCRLEQLARDLMAVSPETPQLAALRDMLDAWRP